MGKRVIRGAKGQLRMGLRNAATQIQELSTIIAVLMKRLGGGPLDVPGAELLAVEPDTVININFDKESQVLHLAFREEPADPIKVTGKDITGV